MCIVEGDMCGAVMRGAVAPPGSETRSCRKGTRRNLGDLVWSAVAFWRSRTATAGRLLHNRLEKSRRQSCRGTDEESDVLVVPMKRSNRTVMTRRQAWGCMGRRAWREGARPRGRKAATHAPDTAPAWHVTRAAGLRIGTQMPITFDPGQEPGAGKPHAGICAGGGEQSPSLPLHFFICQVARRTTRHADELAHCVSRRCNARDAI